MNAYKNVAVAFATLSVLVLFGGCASGPTAYDVRGQADPVLNRDASGKSLSVVVRLYQLKQPTEFSKLAFDSLAAGRPESELLGSDLIEKSEVVVLPGTQHVSTEKLSENANYLGVVAFFRQPEAHYWRYLIPASQVRSKGVTFRLQDCYITLVEGKPAPIPGQPLDAKPECVNTAAASNIKVAPAANNIQTMNETPKEPVAATTKPSTKKSRTKRVYESSKKVLTPIGEAASLITPSTPSATSYKAPIPTPSTTNINLQLPR